MIPRCLVAAFVVAALVRCSSDEPPEPPAEPPPPAAEPPQPAEPPVPKIALEEPADPDEACGQILVVAYEGAKYAPPEITRDKAEATVRAAELLVKARSGADFAELAKTESDAPSSAPRGGIIGSYRKDQWPELHKALAEPLFALKVYEVAEKPVEAEYGHVILRRCKVERARSRHILVRYKGAKRAGPKIERSREEALERAKELRQKLSEGADFAQLAKHASDDSSAARGGDLGAQPRGRLALPYEETLFALEPGQVSQPIESEFGFHIIERLPD